MSESPHFNEEELQKQIDREAKAHPERLEWESAVDDNDLGGHAPRPVPPALPGGKSRAWNIEAARMGIEEGAARRKIREAEARNFLREQQGLPPIQIDPDKI